jgi:hypothetical protein
MSRLGRALEIEARSGAALRRNPTTRALRGPVGQTELGAAELTENVSAVAAFSLMRLAAMVISITVGAVPVCKRHVSRKRPFGTTDLLPRAK